MAAVLPFDPEFRRRRSSTGAEAQRTTARETGRATPRETPLSVRAVRAIAAPELVDRRGGLRAPASLTSPASVARAAATPSVPRAVAAAPAAAVDERALAREFFPLVLIVALLDLATKALAVAGLGADPVGVGGPFALHLVYNTASAGGVSLGEQTRAINFMATGIVVGLLVMLVPTLARLDRRAPAALALIAGGGLGNLVSLGASPHGVPDFLAVRSGAGWWALNVADVALAVGLVLLGRTVLVLVGLVRRHGARTLVTAPSAR